eukprot:CAMPEP_0197055928 /NCGR_PEP_ID=MMETSP1384-20130603/75772_1 /TAXON_ID=29189 /ORGANISM="Ammonia sp." /LENGTH=44 /DNA_ID= /DNA_START= /DNA_END= /DNA_ORIENTATION=
MDTEHEKNKAENQEFESKADTDFHATLPQKRSFDDMMQTGNTVS